MTTESTQEDLMGRIADPTRCPGPKKIGGYAELDRHPRRAILRLIPLGFLGYMLSLPMPRSHANALPAVDPSKSPQVIDPDNRDFWNEKFSDPKTKFNHQPSRLLVAAVRGRNPGLALDLGMGEGRNAIYLAQQGWQVTGVDISDVAVAQTKEHATKIGVTVNAVIDGLDHYDFGKYRWDLIILFYMHAWYRSAKPRSAQRLLDALKPGGLLVVEGFAGDENHTFHTNELLRDFADLRILRYEDVHDEADWAPDRKSHIVRIVAEKTN